jgi:hypothetical protein
VAAPIGKQMQPLSTLTAKTRRTQNEAAIFLKDNELKSLTFIGDSKALQTSHSI